MNIAAFLSSAESFVRPGAGPRIDGNKAPQDSATDCAVLCAHQLAQSMIELMLDALEHGEDPAAIWNQPQYRWPRQYLVCTMLAQGEETAVGHLGPLGPVGMNIESRAA
jgi:hypothetical protein